LKGFWWATFPSGSWGFGERERMVFDGLVRWMAGVRKGEGRFL
jgi:hypothetical protein